MTVYIKCIKVQRQMHNPEYSSTPQKPDAAHPYVT